ncbi:4-coumarate-CoA ligase-like protein [Phyllosticta citriasiana]|uniref:4-coumarate-CoA ligase-like protein n=1 Tax=Phyllosticta citriasiana TaxID=595635 RepID=UPI0030FD2A2B
MPFLASEHFHIPDQDILSWSFDAPQYDLDRPVYIDAAKPSRTINARQARGLIERLVAGFKAAGVKKEIIYFSMAFLGIIGAGGVSAGTNPSYTPFELAHAIRTADVEYLLFEPSLLPNAISAAKSTSLPLSRIMVFNPPGSDAATQSSPLQSQHALHDWQWLLSHGTSDWHRFSDHATANSTAATRLFSSGTTGLPKALNVTHHNLIAQHTLPSVPHARDVAAWLRNVHRFAITEANTVPMMVNAIVNSGLAGRPGYSLATLRNAWCGAAPLRQEQQARFRALLRDYCPFNQVWGMSETSGIATMLYWPEEDRTGGVGRNIPNLDAKIVDDAGNDISAFDVSGELCVRGPTIIRGYHRNDEANARDFDADGFFHTGDVVYRDSRAKSWYIVDRKKELIKVRGFQMAPTEIEGVLLGHRVIAEAAVIGVVLTRDGSELPRAYVVPNDGATLSDREVFDYVVERSAKYKRLEGGNPGGKTLKNQLREQTKRELGGKL